MGYDVGHLVMPLCDGHDVEGYFDGPADGRLVGTLVLGRELGYDEG